MPHNETKRPRPSPLWDAGQIYGDGVQYQAAELISTFKAPSVSAVDTAPLLIQQDTNRRNAFPKLKACVLDCNANADFVLARLAFHSECTQLSSLSVAHVPIDDVMVAYLISIANRATTLSRVTISGPDVAERPESLFWVDILKQSKYNVVITRS